MPTESPKWWQIGLTDKVLVLANDLLGGTFPEEVNLKITTGGDVAQYASSIIVFLDNWALGVCVSEENTEEHVWCSTLHQGERMDALGSFSSSSFVVFWLLIVGPHCPGSLFETKLMIPLSEAINALGW